MPKFEKDYKLSDAGGKYRLLELRNTHREFGKENPSESLVSNIRKC